MKTDGSFEGKQFPGMGHGASIYEKGMFQGSDGKPDILHIQVTESIVFRLILFTSCWNVSP